MRLAFGLNEIIYKQNDLLSHFDTAAAATAIASATNLIQLLF